MHSTPEEVGTHCPYVGVPRPKERIAAGDKCFMNWAGPI